MSDNAVTETETTAPEPELEFTDEPHRWTIEPHPSRDFDALVTNSDNEARHWIREIAESHLWDDNDGEERTMTVSMNPSIVNTPSDFDLAAPADKCEWKITTCAGVWSTECGDVCYHREGLYCPSCGKEIK